MRTSIRYSLLAIIVALIAACGGESTNTNSDLLEVGEQCYKFKNETTEATVKLTYNEDGTVSGTSDGWVEDHENSYFTSWEQTFTGHVENDTLKLNVITLIELDEQNENQLWTITTEGLLINGNMYTPIDCTEIEQAEETTGNNTTNTDNQQPTAVKGVYVKGGHYDSWIFAIYKKEGVYFAHYKYYEGMLPPAEQVKILELPLVKDFAINETTLEFSSAENLQGFFDIQENVNEVLFTSDEGGDPLILSYDETYTQLLDRIKM